MARLPSRQHSRQPPPPRCARSPSPRRRCCSPHLPRVRHPPNRARCAPRFQHWSRARPPPPPPRAATRPGALVLGTAEEGPGGSSTCLSQAIAAGGPRCSPAWALVARTPLLLHLPSTHASGVHGSARNPEHLMDSESEERPGRAPYCHLAHLPCCAYS